MAKASAISKGLELVETEINQLAQLKQMLETNQTPEQVQARISVLVEVRTRLALLQKPVPLGGEPKRRGRKPKLVTRASLARDEVTV